MFDEVICAGIRSGEHPVVDYSALLRLAHLLDSARPKVRSAEHEPANNPQKNAAAPGPGSAIHAASGQRQLKQTVARANPDQVPPPDARLASGGGSPISKRRSR